MEFQHFRWKICFILGIVLIFSFTEGKKSCVDKYISKGYFDQKAILDDTEFDNFVKNEVSSCSCQNIPPRLLNMDRNLIGEGSHRRLSSTIRLEYDKLSGQFCDAIIIEKLPHGVFADPFELQHLVHRKVFSDAVVFGDTNLELLSFCSNRSLVEIHTEIKKHMEINTCSLSDAKLAKDFQVVLKEFQKPQRLAAERETAYTPFVPQSILPSSYTTSEIDASSDRNPEQQALLVESRRQEVLLLDNEISFNEAIIEEREQGIQEIQQQIGEVNEIFKDLAVLVHEQGTMIDDIGSNVENALAATAQGKSQLAKAAKTQRSNSSLTCLLLVIFGIVILIVIIVLAA